MKTNKTHSKKEATRLNAKDRPQMTLEEAIEKGRQLIVNWWRAYAGGYHILMVKFKNEIDAFEGSLMRDYDDDFVNNYYNGVYKD